MREPAVVNRQGGAGDERRIVRGGEDDRVDNPRRGVCLFCDDFELEIDEVIDEVHPEALEKSRRTVDGSPYGAVEGEGRLRRGGSIGRNARGGVNGERPRLPAQRELSIYAQVRPAGIPVIDRLCTCDGEARFGKSRRIKEVVALEMGHEHRAELVVEVVAMDGREVDDDLSRNEGTVLEVEMTGFECDAAPMLVEEIAADPFDLRFCEVEFAAAVGN